MRVSILGSSSEGNSTYIEIGKNKYLIDAGFSCKRIVEKLDNIGVNVEEINGIFVTHEHSDHINGLGVLMRKYDIPLYIHKITFNNIREKIGKINMDKVNFLDKNLLKIEDCIINNFEVMHDAEICLGFTFQRGNKKIAYASDVGCITNIIRENFKNSDVIIIESNYDYNMLMTGSYHWKLKNRVKGRNGHLSNGETTKFISQIISNKLKKVYLLHISKENNKPELAHNTLKEMLLERGYGKIEVEVALKEETKLYTLGD